MNKIEERIFGQVFLPEHPDKKISGVWLNIKSNSIFLEVPLDTLEDQNWQILHGKFNGLDKVTFVNAFASGGSSGSGGTWRKVIVSYLIKGCYINRQSELSFKKLVLVSPTLSDWVKEPEGINRVQKNTFQIPDVKEIFSVIFDEIKISLFITYNYIESYTSLSVDKEVIFSIESNEKIHIDKYSEIIKKIKRWILFITNKNPEFSEYHLSKNENDFYELINTLDDLKEHRFTQNLSLNYYTSKECLGSIFSNWMKNESLLGVIELVQEKNYNVEMSFQGYFLNMCVAVECFHDKFISERNKDLISERQVKRKLISDLIEDKELKRWFRSTSKYWEKADLRDRLRAYKDAIEEIMGTTFAFSVEELINKVVKTRNSMAHDGSYNKHLSHIELFLVGKVIEFTLKYEILNLLGYINKHPENILDDSQAHISTLARINNYSSK